MAEYHYTGCGLENVIIKDVQILVDDGGEEVICIRNVNSLHKAIASSILTRRSSMSGSELRFIRTEMGLTQAQLAELVHRESLAVSRWEREECPIDSNAEAIIRLYAMEALQIEDKPTVQAVSESCVQSATKAPIEIDGSDPSHYRPLAA